MPPRVRVRPAEQRQRLLEQRPRRPPSRSALPLGARPPRARRRARRGDDRVPSSSPSASQRRASVMCPWARQKRLSAAVARSASSTRPDESSQSSAARGCRARARAGRATAPDPGPASSLSAVERELEEALRVAVAGARRACRRPAGARARARGRSRASRGALRRRWLRSARGSSRRAPRDPAGTSVAALAIARASSSAAPSAKTASVPWSARWLVGQALVAPVDRRTERALALGKVDRPLHLEREPLAERTQDLRGREDDEPRRDELDRERQPVEPAADLVDRRERVGWRIDAARGRELDEERRRVVDREWLERQDVLGREAQRRTARREHLEIGRAIEELGDVDGGRREVLEVVEEEERAAFPRAESAIAATSTRRPPDSRTPIARAIALGTSSGSATGASPTRWTGRSSAARAATSSASRLLPAPPGPVIVTRRASGSPSRRSTRASASLRPTSRWCSAGRLVAESVLSGGKSSRRPGATSWKSCAAVGTSFSRWRPERAERGARQRLVARDVACRARDDDLLSVRGGADARGDDDVHADVALVAELGLAGVDTDPQSMRLLGRPRLGRERALDLRQPRRSRRALARRRGTRRRRPSRPRRRRGARAAARTISRIRARAGANRSPRRWSSRVEPSTSAKRSVTVPAGRSRRVPWPTRPRGRV